MSDTAINDTTDSGATSAILVGQPLSKTDVVLQQGFADEIVQQSKRLDELAKQLITLELAIPGVYAAVLKMAHGPDGVVVEPALIITFSLWALALGLTLVSLIPVKYSVDPDLLDGESSAGGGISVRAYFSQSAKRKRDLLLPACGLVFVGICFAVFNAIFQ